MSEGHYHQKQIGIEDGLSQPSITTVMTDNHGNVWIGTRFGLNRYRNGRVKCYIDNSDQHQDITGNQVGFLFLDSEDRLWTSTDLGLSVYSEMDDTFRKLRSESVLCAAETEYDIFFGGYEGLLIYDKANGEFRRDLPSDEVPVILDIYNASEGKLLLVGRNGLYHYDLADGSWTSVPLSGFSDGQMILQSLLYDDALYLSCYRQGLYEVNPGTGTVLRHWNVDNSGLTFNIILSMTRFRDYVLLGTDGGGICVLDPESGKISSLNRMLSLPSHFFPSNSFTCLYVSGDDSVWAGSVRNGLFNIRKTSIRSFTTDDGLSENVINDLCLASDGKVYLATDGGGLNIYCPEIDEIGPAKGFGKEIISSVCRFSGDKLLMSEFSGGLYVYDPSKCTKTRFYIVDKENDDKEIQSGYTPKLIRSGDYVFILGAAAYCYDLRTSKFYRFPDRGDHLAGLQGFSSDGKGGILAFSYNQILRLNALTRSAIALYTVNDLQFINTAALKDDIIWIGTDYGVKYISEDSDEVSRVETEMFNRVTRLQATADSLVWITADHGLFCYDTVNGRLETIDESEGFAPHEILCSAAGEKGAYPVYLGGLNGLVAIYDNDRTQSSCYSPEFYEATMDGHRVLDNSRTLVLPRDYKNFDVTVNVLGADAFSRRPIRYTLNGHGSRTQISYEDNFQAGILAPGKYHLLASCLNPDGNWCDDVEIITFKVPAPWFLTWWFIGGMFVLILGSLAFLWQYLTVRQSERYANERVRFLTQISHEIRTPLTLIYVPLKRLLVSAEDEKLKSSLDGVFRNVSRMKDITDVVLDREKMFVEQKPSKDLSENFPVWSKVIRENGIISLPQESLPDTNLSEYRILCVEDNPELRQLMVDELTPFCKEVRTACDGEEGLEAIRSYMPDVIVSDVMMPKMDGFELCRQVKADISISHIPLVLLTARADAASILTGYKAGADSYLAKPFDTALLLQVIDNMLASREKMRQRFLSPSEKAPSPEETTFTQADEAFLAHLNQFIEGHLDQEELDVNAICSEMAMSRASLYNKVKAITGLGVAQYVESIKMHRACELLVSTDKSIAEISDSLGFSSSRYFSTRFKQVTGKNPGS
ncbi:MAG: response regulator, partial [Bacteroidales bacterium]|nr:response regulator [Bacteroidales bacterium]